MIAKPGTLEDGISDIRIIVPVRPRSTISDPDVPEAGTYPIADPREVVWQAPGSRVVCVKFCKSV